MKYKLAALLPAAIVRLTSVRLQGWWITGRLERKYPNGLFALNDGEEWMTLGEVPDLPEDIYYSCATSIKGKS